MGVGLVKVCIFHNQKMHVYLIYLCSMTKSLVDYRKRFLQLKLSLANYLLIEKISKSDHVYHKGKIVI